MIRNNWTQEKEDEFLKQCEIERQNKRRELTLEEESNVWERLNPPEIKENDTSNFEPSDINNHFSTSIFPY